MPLLNFDVKALSKPVINCIPMVAECRVNTSSDMLSELLATTANGKFLPSVPLSLFCPPLLQLTFVTDVESTMFICDDELGISLSPDFTEHVIVTPQGTRTAIYYHLMLL